MAIYDLLLQLIQISKHYNSNIQPLTHINHYIRRQPSSTMPQLQTDNPHRYFCYLLIKHDIQQYMGFIFLILCILLLIKSVLQFRKAKSIGIINSTVRIIYVTIWLWAISFLIKYILSEIVYILQKQQEESQQAYFKLSIASKYVFVVDITTVFLLQTSLICVCYNWVKDIVNQIRHLDDSQVIDDRQLKSEIRLKKLLKTYLILRFFLYLMVIPFIIVDQPVQQNTIVKIMLVLLLVQAFLVLILLITGVLHVRKNKKLNQLIQPTELDTMVNRYAILILCAILRLGLDSIFVYMNFEHLSENLRCYINDMKPTEIARVCVDFFLSGLFTHCIPVFVILRIYNVIQLEDMSMSDSLIITGHTKDSADQQINTSR